VLIGLPEKLSPKSPCRTIPQTKSLYCEITGLSIPSFWSIEAICSRVAPSPAKYCPGSAGILK
jgi:hypothetical protein